MAWRRSTRVCQLRMTGHNTIKIVWIATVTAGVTHSRHGRRCGYSVYNLHTYASDNINHLRQSYTFDPLANLTSAQTQLVLGGEHVTRPLVHETRFITSCLFRPATSVDRTIWSRKPRFNCLAPRCELSRSFLDRSQSS